MASETPEAETYTGRVMQSSSTVSSERAERQRWQGEEPAQAIAIALRSRLVPI